MSSFSRSTKLARIFNSDRRHVAFNDLRDVETSIDVVLRDSERKVVGGRIELGGHSAFGTENALFDKVIPHNG